jgi:hypothetical protein
MFQEAETIKIARQGVKEAFRLLLSHYVPSIYLFCLLRVGDDIALTRAVVDAVFREVFSILPSIKPPQEIGPLLFVVASRVCAQIQQRQILLPTHPYPIVNAPLFLWKLLAEIRKLPENYQLPLLLSYTNQRPPVPPFVRDEGRPSMSDKDFVLLSEKGKRLLAISFSPHEWEILLFYLSYQEEYIAYFMSQLTDNNSSIGTFFDFFLSFATYCLIGLAMAYLVVASFQYLFLTISLCLLVLLVMIKLAAILERWYGYRQWDKTKRS